MFTRLFCQRLIGDFISKIKSLDKQFFRQQRFRSLLYTLIGGITLIVILIVGLSEQTTVIATQTPTPVIIAQNGDEAEPIRCKVNAYVMRLNDFDFVDSTFFIDVWLGANCDDVDAPELNTLDFPSVKIYKLLNTNRNEVEEGVYLVTNLEGIFTKDWNLKNYPFDRHKLEVFFENGGDESLELLVFEPDLKASGIHPDLALEDGWEIVEFNVESGVTHYATNFGDPMREVNETYYSKLMINFEIKRTSYLSFIKLAAGVYIAFIFSALCVLFDMRQNDLFTASLGILVACLFAVFVNLQVAESIFGTFDGLTLVDKIHITTMFFIVIVCIIQTIFHVLYKKEKNYRKLRLIERFGYGLFIVLYLLTNVGLIVNARLIG
ncbi:MAG: hypothetical protein SAJ37_10620 [Oscillatoria sp. PMC 1068.18]|nr:hypothetical protein [Oscillatoria sp. PMC 1076.18]MEC4989193.1 hypothetical protein [Oscillatoria sp. PMC 1068.18]